MYHKDALQFLFFLWAKICIYIYIKSVQVVLIFVHPSVHVFYVRLSYRNMLEILEFHNPHLWAHWNTHYKKYLWSNPSPIQESRFNIYWTKKWNGSSKSLSKYLSHLQQKKIASSINLCPLKILELNNPCWLLLDFFLEPINPYIQLQFYFSTFNPTVSHTQNPSKKPQH